MDLKHKHWAVIAIGVLIGAFGVLLAWYVFGSHKALAPGGETASSTPVTATTTASVPAPALHITEHAAYYDVDMEYPSATPLVAVSAAANAQAVATMKAAMQQVVDQFKKDGGFATLTPNDVQMMGLDQRKEALSSEYKTYIGARTVSYSFLIYEDTLGAHPNGFFQTFTFDTKTGAQLSLGDIFLPSIPYLERVSNRARTDLPGIIGKMSGGTFTDTDSIKMGTAPTKDNFSTFYISGKNLVIVFPPYQVGPYALGTVEDPIPLAQLADSLKAEYR
ncbi:MAG: hypothetical protein JWL75_51 [Parcubacteria group bacterium]|nr:hypothetical protein [Parcubacteria group bacterium]